MSIWESEVNYPDTGIVNSLTQGRQAKVVFYLSGPAFWKAGKSPEGGKC